MDNQIENQLADQHLVKKILSGDKHAFGTIVKNTEGLVAMIVFKMIPNSVERKDIAQDIFLKAFHNLAGFQFKSKLSTWIGQISYNTCLHYLEKKKLPLIGNISEEITLHPGDNYTDISLFKKELSGILQHEITQLPPVYQTLITLFHLQELSYDELAAITGLPPGTIKSYLFRARKMLKDNLAKKYQREEL